MLLVFANDWMWLSESCGEVEASRWHDERPRTEIGSGIAFEKKMNRYVKLGVRDFIVGYEVSILYEWLREHGAIARRILGVKN